MRATRNGVSPTANCGEIQTMSHVVNSCPLTKFDGGLLRLHEADEAAVDWLTTYGSEHTIIILIVLVRLSVPVQVIDWKDSSPI